MSELIFDKQINYGWGKTFNMTGKAPIVSKRIFEKLSDAYDFINDYNDSAIEGLLLSVISDGDNNGVYRVAKIATKAGEEGSLAKLVEQDALDAIVNDFNVFIIPDGNQLPEENIKEGKIYLIQTESSINGNVYTEYTHVNDAWEILGEYRASVDLSPYYTKTEVDNLISTTEGKLIFGGGENNTIIGKNGHEANFKFRPTSLFESDINSKGTSVISQNIDKIELKNGKKSVTLNSNGFYYGSTSVDYNQVATINDINKISSKIPTNISDFEGEYNIISPLSNTFNIETLYNDENEKQGITFQYKHRDDGGGLGASIKVGSDEVYDGAIKISSGDYYREVGFNTLFINSNGSYIFHSAKDEVPDGALVESNKIATKGDINDAIDKVIAGDISGSYVSKNDIKTGNVDNIVGETDGLVASVKHTHNYIKNNGITDVGGLEGGINFSGSTTDIYQGADVGVYISDKTGEEKVQLYAYEGGLTVNNNGLEVTKGSKTMAFDGTDLKVNSTKVSLEGHNHNNLYYTEQEIDNKLSGKLSGTIYSESQEGNEETWFEVTESDVRFDEITTNNSFNNVVYTNEIQVNRTNDNWNPLVISAVAESEDAGEIVINGDVVISTTFKEEDDEQKVNTLRVGRNGLLYNNTHVSIEGHIHNQYSLTSHTHNYEEIKVDNNINLKQYISTLENRIASLESIITALTVNGASIITTANVDNYAVTPRNIPNYAVTSIHTKGSDITLGGYASEGYYSGIVSINLAGISNIAFDDAISIDANNLGAN